MSRTKFGIENYKDEYLHSTKVENLFINEMLPAAPGDYVKLYIFGLMYAQNNQEMNEDIIARVLDMHNKDIAAGWNYWEQQGAVRITTDEDGISIEYVSQIERYYGRHGQTITEPRKPAPELSETEEKLERLIDGEIASLYNDYEQAQGRPVSAADMNKLRDLVKVYGVTPDVVSYSIKYCSEIEKYNIDYISKVAMRWAEEGCRTILDVKEYLDKYSKRNSYYATIFKEMGFNRLPSPADRDMMGKWFDEMGYSLKDVIEACRLTAGQREPSLRYVNKVLENKLLEAGGINTGQNNGYDRADRKDNTDNRDNRNKAKVSNQVLNDYYRYLRETAEKEANARIDEVCAKVEAMRDVFSEENRLNAEIINLNLGQGGRAERNALKEKRQNLEIDKRLILRHNGYSDNYLDIKYKCSVCNDTGETKDGMACVCRAKRAEEAYEWIKDRN